MTVIVVDVLEIVEIDECQREAARLRRALEDVLDVLLDRTCPFGKPVNSSK